MTQKTTFMLAMGAAAAGTLCFVAAQPQFDLLAPGTAKFAGIGCFLVSGLFWAVYGLGAGKGNES